MQILTFPDYLPQAQRLGKALGAAQVQCLQPHPFPDGETLIRLPEHLEPHVILCRGLDRPNQKLIELLLACRGARAQGVRRISLIAPYLCYMRQDAVFHPGEAVSQRIIGDFLAGLVDDVITVDAHLHRTPDLAAAVPVRNAVNLSAAPVISAYIRALDTKPLLLGPDSESRQWVERIAHDTGLEPAVASKVRLGDRSVQIRLPQTGIKGRDILLIDDVISTGHTLITATRELLAAGAGRVDCIVTHALFTDDACQALLKAGVSHIWSTDSIGHASNCMPLADIIAQSLRALT